MKTNHYFTNCYGNQIEIETYLNENFQTESCIKGLPKKIVDRIEDLIREWQANEFNPSGNMEWPCEIESILLDWLGEGVYLSLGKENLWVEMDEETMQSVIYVY